MTRGKNGVDREAIENALAKHRTAVLCTLPKRAPGWCCWCGDDVPKSRAFRGTYSVRTKFFCSQGCRIAYFDDFETAKVEAMLAQIDAAGTI